MATLEEVKAALAERERQHATLTVARAKAAVQHARQHGRLIFVLDNLTGWNGQGLMDIRLRRAFDAWNLFLSQWDADSFRSVLIRAFEQEAWRASSVVMAN